jgi:hypothetical protein
MADTLKELEVCCGVIRNIISAFAWRTEENHEKYFEGIGSLLWRG